MPANNTKRILTRLKLLRAELKKWDHHKFKGKNSHLTIAKWIVQTLDIVEEHRDLNSLEINLRIRLKICIRNISNILEEKWQ
jgi:hypothetical protein